MRISLAVAALLLSGAPTVAQIDHKIVFPLSLAHTEGNTHENTVVNQPYMRWQQIDSDSLNNSHIVKYLRFRQDSFANTPTAKNRIIDAQITMGAGIVSLFGNDFAKNYLASTSQVIMNRKSISLPDWSQPPTAGPKPFDMTFPMDFIWQHNGFTNLVWEIEVWENTPGPGAYHIDADSAPGTATATTTALGLGCTTNNGVFTNNTTFNVTNYDANFSMTLVASGAPSSSLVSYLIGSSDPNLALGWCSSLRVLPTVSFPIGIADLTGNAQIQFNANNYNPAWFGVKLYTQAVAPDATQPGVPLAFSNGAEISLPPTAHDIRHIYSTSSTGLGQGPIAGGIIVEISDTN